MPLYRVIAMEAILLLLSGCYISTDDRTEAQKKVDAEHICDALGYIPPYNADYDRCVLSEQAWNY